MAYSFNKNKGFNSSETLPVGGYVCAITAPPKYERWNSDKNAYEAVNTFAEGNRTVVPFDIMEGDYAGYFENKFRDDEDKADRKWKGVLYLRHPSDNDKYDTNERRYNSFGAAIEDSNPSFTFSLDNNAALRGKWIGIVFREKEFETKEGTIRMFAEPYSTYSIDAIREGKYKIPKRSVVSNSSGSSSVSADFIEVKDNEVGELPF